MTNSTSRNNGTDDGLPLCGLDGTNPLGFRAALGVLRLLSLGTENDVKMSWKRLDGTWRPILSGLNTTAEDLGSVLKAAFSKLDVSVWSLDENLPFAASRLRQEVPV